MLDKNFWVGSNETKKLNRDFWVGKETTTLPKNKVANVEPKAPTIENSARKTEIESRMSELNALMKDTDTKLRRIGYTETERTDFQNQYKTYKDEYYKLKNELNNINSANKNIPIVLNENAPKAYFTKPKENKTFGDKAANFFKVTVPNAIEDTWDDIKYPITGPSAKQLLVDAKLTPQMLADDAKIQLAKENPTWREYALVKPTRDIVEKYGMPDSKIKAISGDNTQLLEDLKSAEKTWQASPIDATGANAWAAGTSIFGNLASFANSIGADKVPLLNQVTNFAVEGARKAQENAQQYNRGSYGEALGTVTQGIVNLVPYFIVGTGKAAVKGATTVTKYAKYIEPIIKNPSFWYSLTSMWGNKYQEKLNEGYNRFQALGNAILYALPSAIIEVGGGIGAKGKESQTLLRTMGEEIAEEIAQDIMSGGADKIATNHDLPIFSMTEDAIINPKELAKTALYTAPIVGIAGGANRTLANMQNAKIKKQQIQNNIEDYKANSQYGKYIPQNQIKGTEIAFPQKIDLRESPTNDFQGQGNKSVLALPPAKMYVDEQGNVMNSKQYSELDASGMFNKRTELINKINGLNLSDSEKTDLLETLNGMELTAENEQGMRDILSVFDSPALETKLNNISNNFKENKKKYAEYANDNTEYDKKYIENAKNIINSNKSGRRTKEQWLQVAKNLGSQIYEMNDAEIERIAYKTWIDNRPNNKENLNRQGQKFVKFGLDEWVNTVYDTVREARNMAQTVKARNTLPTQKEQVINYSPVNSKQRFETRNLSEDLNGRVQILPTQKAQETLQSAKIVGMSNMDMKRAIGLNNMLQSGAKLKFYDANHLPEGAGETAKIANGFYLNGTLWINKDSQRQVEKILGHELTHYLEKTSAYNDFAKAILDHSIFYDYITSLGYTTKEDFKNNLRKRGYSDKVLDSEMVAMFIEDNLFSNQESINRLARENRTLAQKIKNWLSDMILKVKGTSQEKELLKIENMYKKALAQANSTENTASNTKYSFAGINAKNAKIDKLREAEKLEVGGASAEEIYQQTGWYRGNEGKWRFEIDDSKFNLKTDIRLEKNNEYKLSDILIAPELFEAYPELSDMKMIFEEMDKGEKGSYSRGSNPPFIMLSNDLISDSNPLTYEMLGLKYQHNVYSTLMHEIQHFIQTQEGFSSGSSIEKWNQKRHEKMRDAGDKVDSLERRRKFAWEQLKKEIGFDEKVNELSQIKDAEERADALETYRNSVYNSDDYKIIAELDKKIKDAENEYYAWDEKNPGLLYKNTAGEQEARNVQERINMSSEEKKKRMPLVKTLATVYAEDNGISYSIGGEEGMKNFANNQLTANYKKAIKMSKQGYTNNDIIEQTGWFKDKNGDWKFEFTDKYMKLKENVELYDNETYKLKDILEHELLFEIYPQLADYKLEFENLDGQNATFISPTKTILVDPNKVITIEEMEGTLIHEIQHAIQKIEGFEKGRNRKRGGLAYYRSLGEIEAADVRNRYEQEKAGKLINENPISSQANPTHPNLDRYLKTRTEDDIIKDEKYLRNSELKNKIKDGIYNFLNKEGYDEATDEFSAQKDKQDIGLLDRDGLKSKADKQSAFSMPTDNKGKKLSEKQQEYFKNSKIRDDKGRLIEVYHRTNQDFTEFDRNKIGSATDDGFWGRGFYFSNLDHEHYGKNVIKGYLNITNPLVMRDFKSIQEIAEYLDIVERNFHYEPDGLIRVSYDQIRQFTSHVIEKGHDGVIAEHDNGVCEYVIFEPNQIKEVTNTEPTENPDIRYSISDNQGRELSKEQQEFFKESKVRDEQGRLMEVYHGTNENFTVFDKSYLGTGSGDLGFLGDGFYFATHKGEAGYYGGKVMPVYLNIKNPYNLRELFKYNGKYLNGEGSNEYLEIANLVSLHKEWGDIEIESTTYGEIQKEVQGFLDNVEIKYLGKVDDRYGDVSDYWSVKYKDYNEKIMTIEGYSEDSLKADCLNKYMRSKVGYINSHDTMQYITEYSKYEGGKSLADVLQEKGYDGIFQAEYIGDEIVAFNPEQIKNVDNTNPTENPDIRYSISDNQGRKLSKEQQEYFKNSKVRDAEGNLLEVYHGTDKGGFTTFSGGTFGVNYYTDKMAVADSYTTKNSQNNKIYNGYINIENPLIVDVQGRKWSAIRRDFIEDADVLKAIDDYLGNKYNIFSTTDITKAAKQTGKYDGVIFKNIYDFAYNTKDELSNVYATFNSNQFKNIDNTDPTENPDIRYSKNPVDNNSQVNKQGNLLDEVAPIDESKVDEVEETEKVANILTTTPKAPAKDLLKQGKDVIMRKLVDAGHTIDTVGKITGDKNLYQYYNNTKQARQAAEYMIGEAQTDIKGNRVGNSLIRIFEPIRAKGDEYTNKFFEYLLHMHNIDRMKQNKPVFGHTVLAEDSSLYAKQLLKEYPEFEQYANKVYAYNRNLMQWRVDSGLISKEQADIMNEMYPHYVPTFRNVSGTAGSKVTQNGVQIANTVRKATGSNKDILPIDASMARQTMQTVQAARRNLFGNRLLNDVLKNKEKVGEYVEAIEKTKEKADVAEELDNAKDTNLDLNNVFRIYRNGEMYLMKVNNGIYEGLKSISSDIDNTDTNFFIKPIKAANTMFKQLITGYSPMFTIRNFARDIQDAGLYSKDLKKFLKNYPKAYSEMVGNGSMWQLYKSLGGTGSSFFDYDSGIEKTIDSKNKLGTRIKESTVGKVEELNMMIEQAPRFAEFMATIEKAGNTNYDTLMDAMLNAADITVNFGRSGTWGKFLNSTFVPFLNPSIQGFDKMTRTVLQSRQGKEFAKLAIRATLLGILPTVINELVYGDDDEYENLNDREKDTNFLIKVGDNKWLKIPKGRVLSMFGNTAARGLKTARGEEWDVGEFLKTQASQTAPMSVFDNNLYSPIHAVQNNKTWYGSKIVPQRLEGYAPKDQYDENTDSFSKWLGGILNYSPKKINYLIDAYTGIIGDVALPLSTPKAETNPFTKAFVLDGVTSNEISNDFYKTVDKYSTKQNPKKSAKEVSKYLNKQATQVSNISKQIREIENSQLSDAEKRKQVRELRELANTIELTAMATVPQYEKAVEKYRGTFSDEDVDSEYAYLYANRDIFGAEYAVKTYSKSLYNNHKDENMNIFFNNYFTEKYFGKKSTNTLPTLASQRNKLPPLKK